jgi:hypothetical protein
MGMRSRLNTYTGYSAGCAAVWALILALGERRLDEEARTTLRLSCAGWWSGWLSATIARAGYPPPKKLSPPGKKRLERVSLVLVGLGFLNVGRLLAGGRQGGAASSRRRRFLWR